MGLRVSDCYLFEYRDDWQALYPSLEWPVNTQKLGGLVTGNILPMTL